MTTNMQFACSDHVSGGKLPMECRRHQWVWKFEREIRKRSKLMKVKPPLIALRAMWTNVNQCEPTETCWAVRFFCTRTHWNALCAYVQLLLFGNCTWMHLGCPLEVFVFFYWLHHGGAPMSTSWSAFWHLSSDLYLPNPGSWYCFAFLSQ